MILDRILETTEARVAALGPQRDRLEEAVARAPAVRDFALAVGAPEFAVIAEVKRRSPSAGVIAADLDPVTQATAYARGGAAAISVLTEPDHFGGSFDDLVAVRAAVEIPVLCKDFIVDPLQVWEARAAGADAVLLIVAALDDRMLDLLLDTAAALHLTALVEVHTVEEAQRATAVGALVVGVNNRDLTTFRTDLAVAETIAPHLAEHTITVAESGVSTPEAAARMRAAGYDAILVGEALVRSPRPAELLVALRRAT